MKKQFFRLCSMILVLVMVLNTLPLQSFATDLQENLSATQTAGTTTANKAVIVEEIPSKRTEYTKEFLLNNGLHMAAVYPDAVHYEKDGQWAEIDNTLKTNLNGTITNTAGIWEVSFPQNLTGSKYVSITKDGYTLSFAMAGELRQSGNLEVASVQGGMETASLSETETVSLSVGGVSETYAVSSVKSSAAQIQKVDLSATKESVQYEEIVREKNASRLMYSNVYDNTNIRYDLQSNQVKESIILNQYNSALRGYRFNLNVGELIPVLGEDGHIDFYDAEKEDIVMVMPAPFLVDNAMEYSYDVKVSLTGSGSNYTLTYLLPRQWLADSNRSWPVVLDPVVYPSMSISNIRDHTVAEGKSYSHTWGVLDAGYTEGLGIYRFFLMYKNLPQLTSSDVIVGASIDLRYISSYTDPFPIEVHKVNRTWDVETLTWANQPTYNSKIEDYDIITTTNDWYSWDVTDVVRGWYSGSNTGMMFKATDEVENGQDTNFRQFYSANYEAESKPILAICYRNNNGLEGYWDYTSSSAGRAGTGSVNNFTGNLTWVRTDIGFGGNLMPVTISHVYNANDSYIQGGVGESNESAGNYFGMGYGWRTNYHQRVFNWTKNSSYYIWEDNDGTDHYFKYESDIGAYKDEDNLELTLTTTGSSTKKFSITNKNGDVSYFDTKGRLTKIQNNQKETSSIDITYVNSTSPQISTITDGAGRKYTFTYNSSNMLTKISYMGSSTTEISYVTYGYTNSNLTTITDKDNKSSIYTYDSNHLLTSAQDIDGYKLSYTYNTVSDTYQPYRVINIKETHNGKAGGELAIEYAHNQTTFTDHNDNVQIMQFNDWGNTVSIQDGEGRAQFTQYALNTEAEAKNNTDATAKANQLRVSSKLQNSVGNLLKDSSFESSTLWTAVNSSVTRAISTTAYRGNKSLKLTRSTAGTASGVYSAFTASAGKTYTFSAYVKTGTGSVYLDLNDGTTTITSETLGPNEDWTRLEVTYTNTASYLKAVKARVMTTEATTVYIDCAQVEENITASRYNLIDNGDFRFSGSPAYGWTSSGLASTDTTTTTAVAAAPHLSLTVFQLTGSPMEQKSLSQTVQISGDEKDTFVLAGWARADSAPLDKPSDSRGREFGIQAVFNYTDGSTSEAFTARFNPDTNSQNSWQYSTQVMVAKQDYSSITVKIVYDYNVNTALFDGIQLYKEAFGSSYTYDKDGNVISVKDLQGQTTSYEYNTDGEVAKILQGNKAPMTYTYDDWHNVLTATTQLDEEKKLVYNFEYDDYGNNTKVSIGSGNTKITSTATYTTDGKLLLSTTDAAGKTTTYGYNADTNVLEWVRYPEDTEATRTNYTYDEMYRMASASATAGTETLSASYTYNDDDLLSSITTGSTTYNFGYGDFALRTSISIGNRLLATYNYTEEPINDQNYDLDSLDYNNGDSVEYEYDNLGRVTMQTYEDGATVKYKYSNDGALATVTDSATGITTTYYYDFTDRLMKYVESGTGYSHSVGYEYDQLNNLTALVETINGVTKTTEYTYDKANRIDTVTNGSASKKYTYDDYGRVEQQQTKHNGTVVLTDSYVFKNPDTAATTTQIDTHTVGSTNFSKSHTYTYDENGNILTVSEGGKTTSYVYDSQNQLIRENNQALNYTRTWTYDDAGNILTANKYAYTTGTPGTTTAAKTYGYNDAQWGDLLTSVNGSNITYDGIGNMLSDGTRTFTWQHGRQLASMTKNGVTWTYTYNADGMRTKRTNGTTTYEYVYNGSQLTQMKYNGSPVDFTYDADGRPLTLTYQGVTYYYVTNVQGDVIGITDATGNLLISFKYEAYGSGYYTSHDTEKAALLAQINPLGYRGYVLDVGTQLYYLQSRYYDPELGRFINADIYISTGQGFIGNNMFAYCLNNPVCSYDPTGTLTDGQIHDSVLAAIILSYLGTNYTSLSMTSTLIYYNGQNILNGWGFCDLYDAATGEVWELKKQSSSYTCSTTYAKRQLGKYVNGRLAKDPNLLLSRGGDLVFEKQTYQVVVKNGIYTITYWQECQGILRYSYTFQKIHNEKYIQEIRGTLILAGAAILAAGCVWTAGGAATSVAIAYVPIIIEKVAA